MKKNILFLIMSIVVFIGTTTAQILEPVKWTFSSKRINDSVAELSFTAKIDRGWHLYSQFLPEGSPINRTTFNFDKSGFYTRNGGVSEPKAIEEYDEAFGMSFKFFKKEVTFTQKIKIKSADAFNVKGNIVYQACAEQCIFPDPLDFEFRIEKAKNPALFKKSTPVAAANAVITNNPTSDSQSISKDSQQIVNITPTNTKTEKSIAEKQEKDEDKSLWAFFLVALAGGLVALLTPCIYPMIPMTISYFMHHSESKKKAIPQATFYGFSIMLIYVLIGTVVAVTLGEDFSNWLSTHWAPNIFFFVIFMIFAASFLGMFELTLPSWMINKTDAKADKGGYVGAFFMAFTLVLVSFSCTAPIVGSILALSTQGHIIKPIVGMLGFSLAFALPFSLFAIFPSALNKLPKSGGWLNSVKVVLGFIELALGLKFLSVADQTYHWGLLDREVYLALWIAIFSIMGLYLLGKLKFSHDSDLKHLGVPRLMLAIITFSFVIYLIPGMWGHPLKALSGWLPPMSTLDFNIKSSNAAENGNICDTPKYADKLHLPVGFVGYFDLNQALKCSKEIKKPVFIDFTGHGCVNCREMEANVWTDPRVQKILKEDYIICSLFVDDKVTELPKDEWYKSTYDGKMKTMLGERNSDYQKTKFQANAQPYYVLVDGNGEKLIPQTWGYDANVEGFIKFLEDGVKAYNKK